MAHKTLIGGTGYEIDGGRTLVNGAGYEIDKGRTLIGGTGYEILLSKTPVVTITGTGSTETRCKAYLVIGGQTYVEPVTIEVPSGTTITAYSRQNTSGTPNGGIYLNGSLVSSDTYTYTVNGNVNVVLSHFNVNMLAMCYGKVEITEV